MFAQKHSSNILSRAVFVLFCITLKYFKLSLIIKKKFKLKFVEVTTHKDYKLKKTNSKFSIQNLFNKKSFRFIFNIIKQKKLIFFLVKQIKKLLNQKA